MQHCVGKLSIYMILKEEWQIGMHDFYTSSDPPYVSTFFWLIQHLVAVSANNLKGMDTCSRFQIVCFLQDQEISSVKFSIHLSRPAYVEGIIFSFRVWFLAVYVFVTWCKHVRRCSIESLVVNAVTIDYGFDIIVIVFVVIEYKWWTDEDPTPCKICYNVQTLFWLLTTSKSFLAYHIEVS